MEMHKATLTALQQGQFICQYTQPELHRYLSDEANRDSVDRDFTPFGYEVASVADEVYYLAYANPLESVSANKIRAQFEQYRDLMSPVVSFLGLLQRAGKKTEARNVGDRFQFSDLLEPLVNNPAHGQQLDKLVNRVPFKTTKTHPAEKLQAVLDGMVKLGFLVSLNKTQAVYVFTGKIEHFHKALTFIFEAEDIPLGDDGDQGTQQELL